MSLPDGVTTCLLTYGPITDTFGNLADSITVEVVADRTIVHAASGRTMFDVPVSASADAGGVVQIAVPHTNQSGFRDKQQNSLTGWYYTITLTARFANGPKSDRKVFQPVIGQTTVDLDLISSDGMVTPGVTAPTASVTSVNGQTGVVVVDGGAPTAPAGGFLVYATDDQTVADAYPQYAWLILGAEPAPEAIASDDFARANTAGEGASDLGSTNVGAKPWTKHGFSAAIDSNRARLTAATGNALVRATVDAGTADQDVTVTANPGTPASDWPGVVARYTDDTHWIAFSAYGSDTYRVQAYNNVLAGDGDFPTIGTHSAAVTAGDVLRLVVKGSDVKAYLNGTLVISATDTTVPAGTNAGIVARGSNFTAYFDDFLVRSA